MKRPREYVELMDQFMELEPTKAMKLNNVTREDAACLAMVAYLRELPVEVRTKGKLVVLVRKESDEG